MLVEDGWDALSQARVAAVSGVGRATVYRYWPERHSLRLDTFASMVEIEHAPRTGDLTRDLTAELEQVLSRLNGEEFTRVVAALIERSQHDAQVLDLLQRVHHDGTSQLRAIVADACARQDGTVDLDEAVASLVGPLLYQRLVYAVIPEDSFPARLVRSFLKGSGLKGSGLKGSGLEDPATR